MQLTTPPLSHPYSTLIVGKWLDAIPPMAMAIIPANQPISLSSRQLSVPHSIHLTRPLQQRQSSARSLNSLTAKSVLVGEKLCFPLW